MRARGARATTGARARRARIFYLRFGELTCARGELICARACRIAHLARARLYLLARLARAPVCACAPINARAPARARFQQEMFHMFSKMTNYNIQNFVFQTQLYPVYDPWILFQSSGCLGKYPSRTCCCYPSGCHFLSHFGVVSF